MVALVVVVTFVVLLLGDPGPPSCAAMQTSFDPSTNSASVSAIQRTLRSSVCTKRSPSHPDMVGELEHIGSGTDGGRGHTCR